MNRTALVKKLPRGLRRPGRAVVKGYGRGSAGLRPPPEFLIVGTKRGGTTSLWNYLIGHPQVLGMFPASQTSKSCHFFYRYYGKGFDWYRAHFPTVMYRRLVARRTGREPITGEASPYYMYDPRVAERVHRLLPAVKAIMLLRDPVERAYSHYRERVGEGVEPLSFPEALAAEADRTRGELTRMTAQPLYYSRPHDYYSYQDRGVYLPQVRRWRQLFPAERLLILRSEDLYEDPDRVYGEVTGFLGLDRVPLGHPKRYNYQPAAEMEPDVRTALTAFFREPNAALYAELGRDFGWSR